MKGIPRFIQTRADLQNLFSMAQNGEIDKAALAEKVNSLLAQRYCYIPVIAVDGNTVTTRFFPEIVEGNTVHFLHFPHSVYAEETASEITVTEVEHIEATSEDVGESFGAMSFEKTKITLSTVPAQGTDFLAIYREENFLTRNGFDEAEIKYILGVLAQ